jgi:iron-sulfur cluster assembly accessory protein
MSTELDHTHAPLKSVENLVIITPAATTQLRTVLQNHPNALGIRLGVSGGGCAGLQYVLTPCTETQEGDMVQTHDDLKFYIHAMAAPYLKGTTLDYSAEMIDGGFKFINPNAASTCGCGSSFGV